MFTRDSVIISHNIKTPLTSISRAVGNILQLTYGQLIKSLFANGEQGFFYDPNDLSTMYQDAAGTVPVTGVGQPVGLIRDKSGRNNHAYQTVSASRPVLHAKVNMLFDTEECGTPKWGKTLCTSTQVQELSPTGSKPVSLVASSSDTSTFYQTSQVVNSAPPTRYKFSFYFKGQGEATDDVMSVYVGDASNASSRLEARYALFNPSNVQLVSQGEEFSVATTKAEAGNAVPVGNGWFRVTLAFTTTTTVNLTVRAQIRRGTGTGAPASCLLWGFDLRSVNGTALLPSYQKVVDASNYDTAGFPHYLSFDGADDFLQTSNIDFTATDKMSLFAGVRKLSDVASAALVELSVNSGGNNGAFALWSPLTALANYAVYSRGTANTTTISPQNYSSPNSSVLSAKSQISTDVVILRANGIQVAQSLADQGAGNYGNYPLYIGRRGGTSLPFNGHIYSLIGIGRLTTDTETTAIEKELAKRAGVTLNV